MESMSRRVLFIVVALAAGCDCWDQLEFRNRTSEDVQMNLRLFNSYNVFGCEDGHTVSSYEKELSLTLPVGDRSCHSGPMRGQDYDARDDIEHLTITRAGSTCIDVEGSAARAWFVREDERNVLVIDESRCPSDAAP